MNARPLTYVNDDTDVTSFTISPSHLTYGRRVTFCPNDSHFEIVSTNESLTKRAKIQKHLLRQFTLQWRKDYLLSLRESHASKLRSQVGPSISVGDVVLLKDDHTKRAFWKLARVETLFIGKDGCACAAVVRVASAGRPSILRRSVKHLYPLEISFDSQHQQIDSVLTDIYLTTTAGTVHR